MVLYARGKDFIMAYLNKFQFIGNVGAQPEIKEGTQKSYANFDVAVSDKRSEPNSTQWFKIIVFDKLAEFCGEYIKKGALVLVEGRIMNSKWEDAEGNTQYRTQFIANNIQLLGSKAADAPAADKKHPRKEVIRLKENNH